jgi:tRNA (guanine37-N1)-methyltransferase
MFSSPFGESIVARAVEKGIITITIHNLRDWSDDPHNKVDDYPFGGGSGMIMKAEPVLRCVRMIIDSLGGEYPRLICLSARGDTYNQGVAKELAHETNLVLLCGHYSGIDERICQLVPFEEYSIGDYVLTGGEPGAMVLVDTITRMLPDSLGDFRSAEEDSFYDRLLGYPHYTRPEIVEDSSVPKQLLSGNHHQIDMWRRKEALRRTLLRRPDLLEERILTREELTILRSLQVVPGEDDFRPTGMGNQPEAHSELVDKDRGNGEQHNTQHGS